MTTHLDDTQGLDELLMAHGADAGELTESLKQAILHWVDTEVINAGDPMSTMVDAQVYRELIRAKQRETLIHHGYKQNTKEVSE
jgi:hypothetical protein